MNWRDPRAIMVYGFVLVFAGFALPFLMVIDVIPSTFALNFFSYGASVAGLFLGIIGAVWYSRLHRGD